MCCNYDLNTCFLDTMKTKKYSRAQFRSTDLWVMGPARFRCATLLTSLLIFHGVITPCSLFSRPKFPIVWSLASLGFEKNSTPLGGLEPPAFRFLSYKRHPIWVTAERASQLRHRGCVKGPVKQLYNRKLCWVTVYF